MSKDFTIIPSHEERSASSRNKFILANVSSLSKWESSASTYIGLSFSTDLCKCLENSLKQKLTVISSTYSKKPFFSSLKSSRKTVKHHADLQYIRNKWIQSSVNQDNISSVNFLGISKTWGRADLSAFHGGGNQVACKRGWVQLKFEGPNFYLLNLPA